MKSQKEHRTAMLHHAQRWTRHMDLADQAEEQGDDSTAERHRVVADKHDKMYSKHAKAGHGFAEELDDQAQNMGAGYTGVVSDSFEAHPNDKLLRKPMKKSELLEQLNDQLRKGELKDKTIISKVELADERFVEIYFDKLEKGRKPKKKNPADVAHETYAAARQAGHDHEFAHDAASTAASDHIYDNLTDAEANREYDGYMNQGDGLSDDIGDQADAHADAAAAKYNKLTVVKSELEKSNEGKIASSPATAAKEAYNSIRNKGGSHSDAWNAAEKASRNHPAREGTGKGYSRPFMKPGTQHAEEAAVAWKRAGGKITKSESDLEKAKKPKTDRHEEAYWHHLNHSVMHSDSAFNHEEKGDKKAASAADKLADRHMGMAYEHGKKAFKDSSFDEIPNEHIDRADYASGMDKEKFTPHKHDDLLPKKKKTGH